MQDIDSEEDVKLMVDGFYRSVQEDEILGPIFNTVAQVDWELHLPKMYLFWTSILFAAAGKQLQTKSYSGRPFPPHARLPIDASHFDRWVELFLANVDCHFSGPIAEVAKARAKMMRVVFQAKHSALHPERYSS